MFGFLKRSKRAESVVKPIAKPLAQSVEQRVALSLIRDVDQRATKKRLMEVLAEFPLSLLHELRRDEVSFTLFRESDLPAGFEMERIGASYSASTKTLKIPETVLFGNKAKRLLAHEIGHAVDHLLQAEKSGDCYSSSRNRYDNMNSTHCSRMEKLYKEYTARNLASHSQLGDHTATYPAATFEIRVETDQSTGSVKVTQRQKNYKPDGLFAEKNAPGGWFSGKTYTFDGRKVKYREKGPEQSVTITDGSTLPPLTWPTAEGTARYLQQSGQQAELFADGLGAYLASPSDRAALQKESSSLYQHVKSELARYC